MASFHNAAAGSQDDRNSVLKAALVEFTSKLEHFIIGAAANSHSDSIGNQIWPWKSNETLNSMLEEIKKLHRRFIFISFEDDILTFNFLNELG
jgi:hypothetical protein